MKEYRFHDKLPKIRPKLEYGLIPKHLARIMATNYRFKAE